MTLRSMTGFAEAAGETDGVAWAWEARSVNGRGLDLRLRLPEGFDAIEAPLRAAAAAEVARGSVTMALKVGREAAQATPRLNSRFLAAAIAATRATTEAAAASGMVLAPVTAADLLAMRGVLEMDLGASQVAPGLLAAVLAEAIEVVAALGAARAAEGAALERILVGQIDRIARLCADARIKATARGPRMTEILRIRLEATLQAAQGAGAAVDEARLAQEFAMIALKSDVTEELDRLDAHVAGARDLLSATGPVGRSFDFLTQEFNREVNTLCSKAQDVELTRTGLELKVVVDQMREQVQNVE
jgi:uncharacterized protein (TIGR00255 family)